MDRLRSTHPEAAQAIAVAAICCMALALRIGFSYDEVFRSGWTGFQGFDAWYHMRLIENTVQHMPHRIAFDPYTYAPHGAAPFFHPLFDWLVAGAAWLVGLGSPTEAQVEAVAAFAPAVLSVPVVLAVYFVGRRLFNKWIGLLAGALLAVLPGAFLHRTLLGFTDHHVAEVLFSTLTLLFLVKGLEETRGLDVRRMIAGRITWRAAVRQLRFPLLAGAALGLYLLAWVGGLLLIFLLSLYFAVQFVADHLRGQNTGPLVVVGLAVFGVAGILALPLYDSSAYAGMYRVALPVALGLPVAQGALSGWLVHRGVRRYWYPIGIGCLGVTALGALYAASPSFVSSALSQFRIFSPTGHLITETYSLLFPGGEFSLQPAWEDFTTSFFISLIGIGVLGYSVLRTWERGRTLFLVWSLVMLAATVGQLRFGYYYSVNAALLTGFLSWKALRWAAAAAQGAARRAGSRTQSARNTRRAMRKEQRQESQRTKMRVGAAVVVVFAVAFFPNLARARDVADQKLAMTEGWHDALVWLRENTPEPFEDPGYYYDLYEPPAPGSAYDYPESAYSVACWWDYGHWVTRVARRIPIANPFQQGAETAARLFLLQDPDDYDEKLAELGSRYIVLSHKLVQSKFHTIPQWAGQPLDKYRTAAYYEVGKRTGPAAMLYHPAYFRSMLVRLFTFDGRAATAPSQLFLVRYSHTTVSHGRRFNEVADLRQFDSYEEARGYMDAHEGEGWRLASDDPLSSPVPLEPLKGYELVYESNTRVPLGPGDTPVPEVKVFKYSPPDGEENHL
ncbi:MAG: oligosaccharyl transferase, archaeosortase A system-associated [Chloroflexota bacterium]